MSQNIKTKRPFVMELNTLISKLLNFAVFYAEKYIFNSRI